MNALELSAVPPLARLVFGAFLGVPVAALAVSLASRHAQVVLYCLGGALAVAPLALFAAMLGPVVGVAAPRVWIVGGLGSCVVSSACAALVRARYRRLTRRLPNPAP